jgi:hypothetical protein
MGTGVAAGMQAITSSATSAAGMVSEILYGLPPISALSLAAQ